MKLFTFSFVILTAFQTPAHATADSQSVILLGKGFQDRSNGDTVALACTDHSCTQASFAVFRAQSNAPDWIGTPVTTEPVKDVQTKKEVRNFLKKNMKVNDQKGALLTSAIAFPSAMGLFLLVPTMGGAVALTIPIAAVYAVLKWFPKANAAFYQPGLNFTASSSLDNNGWNWSSQPKVVSHARFEKVVKSLRESPKR